MFMVQALLAADLSALSVVVGCGVHLVRQAHYQAELKAQDRASQVGFTDTVIASADPAAVTELTHPAEHTLFSAPLLDSVVLHPVQGNAAAETEPHFAPPVAEFAARIAMASRFHDIQDLHAPKEDPVAHEPEVLSAQVLEWPEPAQSLEAPVEVAAAAEEDASLFVATPNRQQMGWVDEIPAPAAAVAGEAPVAAEIVAAPLPAEIELDLLADPVDGVAFEAGEQIALCVCRTAYRIPTLEWLRDNNAGNCVQCGRHVSEEHQYILPKATQRELTLVG